MALLLPLATLITPNLPEAEVLAGGSLDAAARAADDCRAEIESIKAEAGNATGTSSDGTQKPSRLGTSKPDDVEASADASVDTGNDASNDDDSEESEDSSDDDSSEEEYEEDFSDEESDEE